MKPEVTVNGQTIRCAAPNCPIVYCQEANEKRAGSYLETVEDVTFFGLWRNRTQAALKSAKFAADRAAIEAGYDARTAKLWAV